MNIIKKHATKFKRYGEERTGVLDSIEIHGIGDEQDDPLKIIEWMNQYNPGGIVHAVVSSMETGEVYEILPDNNVAWMDAGYGNKNSYGIELSESKHMRYKTNSAYYDILDEAAFLGDIRRAYKTAVAFVAYKCKQFGFNPKDKLKNGLYRVYSHQEAHALGLASNHADPQHVWDKIGKNMDMFRDDVAAAMGSSEPKINIKGVKIDDSNVEAISKVVYGEAGVIRSVEALVAVAQCIKDMWETGKYGKTVTEVLENNFSAFGTKETTDESRQAVYDVFINGKKRFENAKILQFRSFKKYSDGNGNMDPVKCAALLEKYDYIGKDARNNQWGHLYFGELIKENVPEEPEQTKKEYVVQAGVFEDKNNANALADQIKSKGFDVIVKEKSKIFSSD